MNAHDVSSRFVSTAMMVALLAAATTPADARLLPIPPVRQETPVWCWVAVGEMVFSYLDVPNVNPRGNYQCGIVGLLAKGTWADACAYRCELCSVPAGNAAGIMRMLVEYPKRVSHVTAERVSTIEPYHAGPLDPAQVISEIEDGSPIIAGISPAGKPPLIDAAAHVALIIGYLGEGADLQLYVNDPFPYQMWEGDPFLRAGGSKLRPGMYLIRYKEFRHRLSWTESFLVREGHSFLAAVGRRCCTYNRGVCGPFTHQLPQPIGSPCSCQYGNPYASGEVCQ